MVENIETVISSWHLDEPKYRDLGRGIVQFIKSKITEFEILPEVSYRTKDLLSIIKKIKKKRIEGRNYSYGDVNDKLGFRIICVFQEDLEKIDKFLKKYFIVNNVDYKQQHLEYDKLAYISNHYELQIDPKISGLKRYLKYKDLSFEMQVRTLNQHAWSNAAHSLSYKQETDLSILNRRIYRLLSLYEIADDEFSAIYKMLADRPDNILYSFLKKLEPKIYKYAQTDFDRDISLFSLKRIISYFIDHELTTILHSIDKFIKTNDKKIKRIYSENRNRFFDIYLLTQPEVFLIWFSLEKYYFSIVDNWENDFDRTDLEQIAILWGISIT